MAKTSWVVPLALAGLVALVVSVSVTVLVHIKANNDAARERTAERVFWDKLSHTTVGNDF